MGTARTFLLAALVLGATCATAQEKQMRIQFAEPVRLKAAVGHGEFDAYGRRFSFDLQRNERLIQGLPTPARAEITNVELLRGKLDGMQGSWVRLTQTRGGIEGAIWDGRELYVVTSLANVQKNLTTPINAAPGQTVVYRLSDTLDSLPERFCGVEEHASSTVSSGPSGLTQYQHLVTHLAAAALAAPAEQVSLALIADTSFQQLYAQPAEQMLTRLNIVDGIFAEQIGVLLQPTEFRLIPSGSNPFTATDGSRLLEQLAEFRENTPVVRAAGLAHLFTNKSLGGNTIGIAYRDALCDPRFGASVSNSELGTFYSALVMAHELGHNFGAEHDGNPGGACAATGSGYLMWPEFNGSSTFSSCSRNTIAQSLARARGICVVPAEYADLAVSVPSTLDAPADSEITLPVTVRSLGNATAIDATLKFQLTSVISFVGADLPEGACSVTGGEVTCELGDIPAGDERVIDVRFTSSQLTSTNIVTTVSAANDYLVANGTGQTVLRFTSGVDLGVMMTLPTGPVYVNDTFDMVLDVTSTRTQAARGGVLRVYIPGLEFESATAGIHTCVPNSNIVLCNLADIPAGATVRIVLHVRGVDRGGNRDLSANVQVTNDGDYTNNSSYGTVQILPENDLLITVSADTMNIEPNTLQEVTFTLSAIGRSPAVDTEFRANSPWNGEIESVEYSAPGGCPSVTATSVRCGFGEMNPGETRTVILRFRTTSNGGSVLHGQAFLRTGPHHVSSRGASVTLYTNLAVDVVASTLFQWSVEGRPENGYAGVQSVGLQPAQDVIATLDVPATVQLTSINIENSADWSCELLTPQRGRCTGLFTSRWGVSIRYGFTSNVPGDHPVVLTVSADGDGDATNNISESVIQIAPFMDAGVTTTETQMNLVAGQDHTVGFTVTTGARPVPGVLVRVSQDFGYEIAAIAANGAPCSREMHTDHWICDFGTLPANAAVPLSVTYRARYDGIVSIARVTALVSTDHNQSNNVAQINYTTFIPTDVQLQVAQTSATAVNGTLLTFPRITVRNAGPANARNPVIVTIPLPGFATIRTISAANIGCSGTTTLECHIYDLVPGASAIIDITLNTTAVGNFTSALSVASANDSSAGDNIANVQLSVTPPQTGGGGSSSGGGSPSKGGGGRIEWLALAFLGFAVAARMRRRPFPATRHPFSICLPGG